MWRMLVTEHKAGRVTECLLCIGLYQQDQPSGISHPGDQSKGMLEERLLWPIKIGLENI